MKRLIVFATALVLIPTSVFGYSGLIERVNSDIPGERAEKLSNEIVSLAHQYNIPSEVIVAMVWHETHFVNTDSQVDVNPKSCGYMQMSTRTAYRLSGEWQNCNQLILNWQRTLRLSVKYIYKQRKQHGNLAGAIAGYNGIYNLDYVNGVLNKRQKVREWLENRKQ